MRIGLKGIAAVGFTALALGACSTHQVPMDYDAAAVAKPASATPTVEVISVDDARKYKGAHLGAIRGGYGNALKTLEATQPVKDVVRKAFTDGLAARGMLSRAGASQYGMEITVDRLDCSQLVRREAHAKFQVALVDKATGQRVYTKASSDDRIDNGNIMETGVFGSVDELHKLVKASMQTAVDQALDDPILLAASSRPAAVVQAPTLATPATATPSTADRLRDLQSLLEQKLITKQEYESRRRAIVDAL